MPYINDEAFERIKAIASAKPTKGASDLFSSIIDKNVRHRLDEGKGQTDLAKYVLDNVEPEVIDENRMSRANRWSSSVVNWIEGIVALQYKNASDDVLQGMLNAYATNPNCDIDKLKGMYTELEKQMSERYEYTLRCAFHNVEQNLLIKEKVKSENR